MMFDRAYGIAWHSFLTPAQAAPEQLLARENYRLPFMKRLFVETLDTARKTFVLRRPDRVHLAEAEAVAAVLRLSADNILLWAVNGQGGQAGSVDLLAPYLMQGHLDMARGSETASMTSWLSICVNAHRARRTTTNEASA